MPDWVPQVAPDLCPRCGAYWECGCFEGAALTVEDMQATVQRIKDAPDTYNWSLNPFTDADLEKASNIERGMTQISDELGLDWR